jgi:hypothetical protein
LLLLFDFFLDLRNDGGLVGGSSKLFFLDGDSVSGTTDLLLRGGLGFDGTNFCFLPLMLSGGLEDVVTPDEGAAERSWLVPEFPVFSVVGF